MVTKLSMIILMERDIDAAVDFYARLGLAITFRMRDKWAELSCGDIKIGLCPTTQQFDDRHAGVVFEVPDLTDLYGKLKDEINFVVPPVEKPHGIMASIKDPSGNILDLYQPTPEKLAEFIADIKQKGEAEDQCCGGKACSDDQEGDYAQAVDESCCSNDETGCC